MHSNQCLIIPQYVPQTIYGNGEGQGRIQGHQTFEFMNNMEVIVQVFNRSSIKYENVKLIISEQLNKKLCIPYPPPCLIIHLSPQMNNFPV